ESALIEKDVPDNIRRLPRHVVELGVESSGQRVDGKQIHTAVPDKCRPGSESVERPLQTGSRCPALNAAPFPWSANRACRVGQIEKVCALGFVEHQCLSKAVEHFGRGSADVAAFEFCVVLDTHPGERGDLTAT